MTEVGQWIIQNGSIVVLKTSFTLGGFHCTEVAFVLLTQPPRVQISSFQKYYPQWIFERSALRDKGDAQTHEQYLMESKNSSLTSARLLIWLLLGLSRTSLKSSLMSGVMFGILEEPEDKKSNKSGPENPGCLFNAAMALIQKHWVRISKLLFWWECSNAPYRTSLYKTSPRCPKNTVIGLYHWKWHT